MRTISMPVTARQLFDLLGEYHPVVEADVLVIGEVPHADLGAALGVLHTGVRARLVERRWWGSGVGRPQLAPLNPSAPIPAWVGLLAVEGEPTWDRIHPSARMKFPHLFDAA